MEVDVFIGVGSNIEPEQHILLALEFLQTRVRVTATSRFYRTRAIGNISQPDFINGVWQVQTSLPPGHFKQDVLRYIEQELGRRRQPDRYTDRCIDLDLLLYGSLAIDQSELELPDPDIYSRNFVALPLYELMPALVLPGRGMRLADVVQGMDESYMVYVRKLSRELKRLITAGK